MDDQKIRRYLKVFKSGDYQDSRPYKKKAWEAYEDNAVIFDIEKD